MPFASAAGTALLRNDGVGSAKIVVDRATGCLLGATFVGPDVAELLHSATVAIVGSSGALGDAGSPASDSTLGPTAGLGADGQHDHIRDSVIPTFLHFNLPLLVAGWIAAFAYSFVQYRRDAVLESADSIADLAARNASTAGEAKETVPA